MRSRGEQELCRRRFGAVESFVVPLLKVLLAAPAVDSCSAESSSLEHFGVDVSFGVAPSDSTPDHSGDQGPFKLE